MELSFIKENWIPNYVTFKEEILLKKQELFSDWFIEYIEQYILPVKKDDQIYFTFNFGEKKIELSYKYLVNLLLDLKANAENKYSDIPEIPKELVDFFGYFNLIDKTKGSYFIIGENIHKIGQASLATLLGHIIVENHSKKIRK